jgi:hypothetical protein
MEVGLMNADWVVNTVMKVWFQENASNFFTV